MFKDTFNKLQALPSQEHELIEINAAFINNSKHLQAAIKAAIAGGLLTEEGARDFKQAIQNNSNFDNKTKIEGMIKELCKYAGVSPPTKSIEYVADKRATLLLTQKTNQSPSDLGATPSEHKPVKPKI